MASDTSLFDDTVNGTYSIPNNSNIAPKIAKSTKYYSRSQKSDKSKPSFQKDASRLPSKCSKTGSSAYGSSSANSNASSFEPTTVVERQCRVGRDGLRRHASSSSSSPSPSSLLMSSSSGITARRNTNLRSVAEVYSVGDIMQGIGGVVGSRSKVIDKKKGGVQPSLPNIATMKDHRNDKKENVRKNAASKGKRAPSLGVSCPLSSMPLAPYFSNSQKDDHGEFDRVLKSICLAEKRE